MSRSWSFFAICAVGLAFCLAGYAQDSPSLGDLARQAQKEKSNAPPKKVFTNDDLPSGTSPGSSVAAGGLGSALGQVGQPTAPAKPSAESGPPKELDQLETILDRLASLDRAALVKTVLQDADTTFTARKAWEDKLVAARDTYVSEGRALVQKARQIEASMENLTGVQDPDDSRAKELKSQLQQLADDGNRTGAAFQAVITEGRALAGQSSAH